MLEGATVTLPLDEFDKMRSESEEYRRIAGRIAACFEYSYEEYAEPAQCKACAEENPDCTNCKVYKESPPFEETLTVDTERLIRAVKQYALYGKNITSDVDEMNVVERQREKQKRGGRK